MDETKLHAAQVRLTERILALMGDGEVGEWVRPWALLPSSVVRNPVSEHKFSGMNTIILWTEMMFNRWESAEFATYKQWASIGAQVKKGEKSTIILMPLIRKEENAATGEEESRIFGFRGLPVFAAEQVDGYTIEIPKVSINEIERIESAQSWTDSVVLNGGIKLDESDLSNKAAFMPAQDKIVIPAIGRFKTAVDFYATLWHELGHWTGGKGRLERKFGKFGSADYAREELVAELTSAFLCNARGISAEPREDHAQYLASWVKMFKGDPSVLWNAFKHAIAAQTMLEGFATTE